MVYRVTHVTSYRYSQPVSICHNEARLTPRSTTHQKLLRSQLLIEPTVSAHDGGIDYFGNSVHWFALQEAHTRLCVTAVSEVDVSPFHPPVTGSASAPWEGAAEHVRDERDPEALIAREFTFESPHVRFDADLIAYAEVSFTPGRPLLEATLDLTRRINTEFTYQPGSTTVATPLRDVLRSRRGVCQDFAHLQIAMLRSLGLAARYVSGYIYTRSSDEGPHLTGADASHAWLGVFCPGFGYVDFDPTNGCIPSQEHVTLAWGRDFSDTSPLKGVILGGGEHIVRVGVDVDRV